MRERYSAELHDFDWLVQHIKKGEDVAFTRLLGEIRAVLGEAIEAGGTTLRDYSRVNGEPGYFEQSLNVYERAGLPCVNCEKIVQRKVIGQRASYYCPRCQT